MRDYIATIRLCAQRTTQRLTWVATLILTVISATWILSATPAQAQSYRFSNITVDGNVRVDDSTVIGFTGITRGQPVTAGRLNAGISRLTASGLFEDVTVTPRGNTLAITVKEYPIIGVVNFEGNRRLKVEQIQEVVRTRPGRVLSPAEVEADARAIAELYNSRGRLAAEVTPKVLPRGNNRVDLAFEIREGNVVEIERVAFVGNRAFSNYRLRQVLSTKQAGALRWLIQSDTFIAERVGLDRRLLTDFYLSRGYVDFEILSVTSEIARERDGFFLTFNIREGQKFNFGTATVTSEVEGLDAAELQRELRVRPGTVFSPTVLEYNIARLEQIAERKGLRFIRAEPRFTRDNRNGVIDVEFAMVRGERIFVERIDIQGNTTTLDRVIRQQFVMAEGDPLNPREIREAAERIRVLEFFSDVTVEPRAGSAPDLAVVDVEVEEQPTGSLGFSVSFGANQGIGFGLSFSEQNFLGRGQQLSATFNTIKGSRDISLFFTEPRLFGRNVSYSVGLGLQETSNQFGNKFDTREAFINNALTFRVSEFGTLQVRQGLVLDRLKGIDPLVSSARLFVDETQGSAVTASLGYTYSYDTREKGLDPTRGLFFSVSQDFNVGNKSRRSVKTELAAGYESAILNEDVKLMANARVGLLHMISGSSRNRERYQLGAIMRGFQTGASGPRDFSLANQNVLGGTRFFSVQMEAQFPLGLPDEYNIKGGVFADIGSVWGVDNIGGLAPAVNMVSATGVDYNKMHVRATLGVSLFWESPLGPLRFDFSRPLRKLAEDKTQNFDFSIVSKF